ncbi:hypothetical protein ACFQ3Z_30195 [Streptomyces nogalater]
MDRVVVARRGLADGGLVVELEAGVLRGEGDGLAADGELHRLVDPLAEGVVQLLDCVVAGAAADVDAEHGGALGHVAVIHQQPGAVGTARDDDHGGAEQHQLAAALLLRLGRLGGGGRGSLGAGAADAAGPLPGVPDGVPPPAPGTTGMPLVTVCPETLPAAGER